MTTQTQRRKQPRQERARQTVQALLEATAEMLEREGYQQLSTNRIADRAGVSIGSLYQYFPSKEALVAALIEQFVEELWASFTASLPVSTETPVHEIARTLVVKTLENIRRRTALQRVLIEQVPRTGRLARLMEFEDRVVQTLTLYMASRQTELAPVDLELAAFLVVQSVTNTIRTIVLHYPEHLERETLVDELTAMVVQYLCAPRGKISARCGDAVCSA